MQVIRAELKRADEAAGIDRPAVGGRVAGTNSARRWELPLQCAALLGEKLIHDFLPVMEVGALEPAERIGEIEKIMPGGQGKNGKSSGGLESFLTGFICAAAVIDQQ